MDGELWYRLYLLIDHVDKTHLQNPAKTFCDAAIVRAHAWSVLHERPTCWACDSQNWPEPLRPQNLPSQPTMSRRLKHDAGVRTFLRELEAALSGALQLCNLSLCWLLDGKPLPIGRYSKDPDAAVGYSCGGTDVGYKAHMLWHNSPLPRWEVRPMNITESKMGMRLVSQSRSHDEGEGYVLADKGYDANALHAWCSSHGFQLLAPPQKAKGAGRGHHPQSPARLHALEMLRRPMGQDLRQLRTEVERRFGNLCSFGGGLAPLPAWVRRLDRVRRWVQMKLIINGLRIQRVLELHAA